MAYIYDLIDTWNNAGTTFTAIKMNVTDTASSASSLLMDLQVGGTSRFAVNKSGAVTINYPVSSTGVRVNGNGNGFVASSFGTDATGYSGYGVRLQSTNTIEWSNSSNGLTGGLTILSRRGDANLRLGASDAASAVAQTLSVQSVAAGTANTAGANFTITGSQGTGTGAGGSIIFQVAPGGVSGTNQNPLVDALTIGSDRTSLFQNSIRIARNTGGETFAVSNEFWVGGGFGTVIGRSYGGALKWGDISGNSVFNVDLAIFRDDANILAQRNSTNAQTFRLYNTFTDASNYERGFMRWNTNVLQIGTEKAGTGTARALGFQTDGTTRADYGTTYSNAWNFNSIGINSPSFVHLGNYISLKVRSMNDGAAIALQPWNSSQNAVLSFMSDDGTTFTGGGIGRWASSHAVTAFRNNIVIYTNNNDVYFNTDNGVGLINPLIVTNSSAGLIAFMGKTSAFPALKRSGTSLQVRLADDSADAPITASSGTFSDTAVNVSALAASGYSLTGSSSVPMVDLTGTWNTTGNPAGIKMNITNTASGANAMLMDLQTGGVSRFNVSKAGAVSAVSASFTDTTSDVSSIVSTGYSLTGSSAVPMVDLSGTWNTTGTPTAVKVNVTDTASNTNSLLMDLQVGGATKFSVSSKIPAPVTFRRSTDVFPTMLGTNSSTTLTMGSGGSYLVSQESANMGVVTPGGNFAVFNPSVWGEPYASIGQSGLIFSGDTILTRDAANSFAQRRGTSPQTFRIYNTYTDTSNWERAKISWSSNVLQIGTEKLGTGTARALEFQTDGTTRLTINTNAGFAKFGGGPIGGQFGWYNAYNNLLFEAFESSNIRFFVLNGRLLFEGNTSAFPLLKRSSATLQARLADDSAFTNVEAAQFVTPTQTLTDGATIAFNANISAVAEVTLTGTGRTLTPSNLKAGATYLLFIKQDGTGNRTITTWTNFKWSGGVAPVLSTAANAIDIISGVSDGTFIYASMQQGFA